MSKIVELNVEVNAVRAFRQVCDGFGVKYVPTSKPTGVYTLAKDGDSITGFPVRSWEDVANAVYSLLERYYPTRLSDPTKVRDMICYWGVPSDVAIKVVNNRG